MTSMKLYKSQKKPVENLYTMNMHVEMKTDTKVVFVCHHGILVRVLSKREKSAHLHFVRFKFQTDKVRTLKNLLYQKFISLEDIIIRRGKVFADVIITFVSSSPRSLLKTKIVNLKEFFSNGEIKWQVAT